MTDRARNPAMLSYDGQLERLGYMFQAAISDAERVFILSVSQSVKEAKEHNLNCRKDPHGAV